MDDKERDEDLSHEEESEEGVAAESAENSVPATGNELEKIKKDYLYLAAEFENYKKHAIKERSDLLRYGTERIVRELLEVVDNFERALSQESEGHGDSLRNGIELIYKELVAILQRFGVKEVNPLGQPFDPNLHEALTSEPLSEFSPGTICRVFKKAYLLYDRLIRPAQVVVASAPVSDKAKE